MATLLLNRIDRLRNNRKELLTFITGIICAIFIAWFAFSYIDIISNNMGSCEYSKFNFFTMFS